MKLPITLSPIDIFDADGISNEDDFVVQTAGGAIKIAVSFKKGFPAIHHSRARHLA